MFGLFEIVNNFQRDERLSVKFQGEEEVSPNYARDYNLHERKTLLIEVWNKSFL